jgi:hypothetical protein
LLALGGAIKMNDSHANFDARRLPSFTGRPFFEQINA